MTFCCAVVRGVMTAMGHVLASEHGLLTVIVNFLGFLCQYMSALSVAVKAVSTQPWAGGLSPAAQLKAAL